MGGVEAFWEPAVHTEHLKKCVGDPQEPTRRVRCRGRSDSNIKPSKS